MNSNFAAGAVELTALGLGIVHALEPGHGKTLMTGILVGSRNKWLDPLLLAVSTAFGHLVSTLLFAILSFTLVHELVPGGFETAIELFIGSVMCIVGGRELYKLVPRRSAAGGCCGCGTSHRGRKRSDCSSARYIVGLGLLVGFVPCPSALALAASTATLDSLVHAALVTCIFALGTALTLLAIGVTIAYTSHRVATMPGFTQVAQVARLIAPISLLVLGTTLLIHTGTAHHH